MFTSSKITYKIYWRYVHILKYAIAMCVVLRINTNFCVAQGVSIYSNANFLSNIHIEPVCNNPQEYFIESDGKESSILLDFDINSLGNTKESCCRILSAPNNFGFIVRLILPKIKYGYLPITMETDSAVQQIKNISSTAFEDTSSAFKSNKIRKRTASKRTCPLSVFSSLEPHTPQWRLDPCQLEEIAPEMEDPVRLFQGRVKIVWKHGLNKLKSKLMVTVLGKGEQCRTTNKHHCLKIGKEPILCISNELACDGIRHCPYSNEYDSDEDHTLCNRWKGHHSIYSSSSTKDTEIFEHFALEVLRSLFITNLTKTKPQKTIDPKLLSTNMSAPTISSKIYQHDHDYVNLKDYVMIGESTEYSQNITGNATLINNQNSTRIGLNSDLSKYGPWGYLMLGILLCGGALLICGLLASATQNATTAQRELTMQDATVGSATEQSNNSSPPNYDEIDPPPAYSALFPHRKNFSISTLNSERTVPPLSISLSNVNVHIQEEHASSSILH